MTIFKSRREQRLWTTTVLVVVAIYATLGLASTLAGLIGNQTLSAVIFLGGMVLIGLVVFFQGWGTKPRGLEIGVIIGMIAVYLFALFRMTIPERSHLIEYSVVAVLIFEALTERVVNGGKVPLPALQAVLLTAAVGAIDELIQLFLPRRVFDPVDILFNSLAALLAVAGMLSLRWVRRWGESRKNSGS